MKNAAKTAQAIPKDARDVAGPLTTLPPKPAITVATERRTVPFSQLTASAGNPRKTFDEAKIAELADSIAEVGVLQELNVCETFATGSKSARPDSYAIIAGERRYRAIKKLIDDGRAAPDYPVPVSVRKMTDAGVFSIVALAENMQREGLAPLEEARRFKELRDTHKISTETIAARLGVTQRHIQQRLALVERLAPEAQKALEAGEINISQARSLTVAKPRQQKEIVTRIKDGAIWLDHARIRDEIARHSIPVKHALFDRALYKGEVIPADADLDEKRDDLDAGAAGELFADHKAFWELQNAAVSAKAAELKAAGAKVQIFQERSGQHFHGHNFTKKPKDPAAFTAISVGADGKVEIVPGIVPASSRYETKPADKKKAAAKADPADAFQNAHREHAHIRKSHALQLAVAADPVVAQRLACFALLVDRGADLVQISRGRDGRARFGSAYLHVAPDLLAALGKALEPVKACLEIDDDAGLSFGDGKHSAAADEKARAAIWKFLTGLAADKIAKLQALLIAHQVGTWSGYQNPLGDDEAAVELAEHIKIAGKEVKHGLGIRVEDLVGLRKPALLGIAADLKVADVDDTMTGKAIAAAIAAKIKAGAGAYVLPTLTFADNDVMRARIKKLVKE